MTPVQFSRATLSSPTLKVIQLPSPTPGIASPVEGIGLVMIEARDCAAPTSGQRPVAALPARSWRSSSRRESGEDDDTREVIVEYSSGCERDRR
jgi:hypothetical protein